MTHNRNAIVVLLAALALASGARVPLQAATTTTADVVFIMEAAQATFTNATTLALNGLTGSAQSYAAGAKTGIYPIQNFTDGSATGQYVDSNGQWLSNPQAVMYGVDQTGAVTTVLLTLSNPTVPQQPAGTVTNNNNNNNNGGSTTTNNNNNNGPPQLTFTVALVPAQASAVKYQNGVVAEKITEASNGAGNLTTSIAPGATFSPVVIYIDQNQQGLPQKATTKWGWGGGGWGNDWNNGYYNNGWGSNSGYSSNNNNNNNNNNGGWGASNNNNNNNNNGGWGANNNNNNNNNNGGGWGSSNNNNNNNNNGK